MTKFLSLLCFIICSTLSVDCARILAVYPVASISHQVAFRPLTLELVKRGHEVVVLTPDPIYPKGKAPSNLIEIDVHDKSYEIKNKFYRLFASSGDKKSDSKVEDQLRFLVETIYTILDYQLRTEEFQDLVMNKRDYFNILLVEAAVANILVLSHVFNVPVIQISSFGSFIDNYEVMGSNELNPFLYPLTIQQRIYNLTLWEKVTEFYKLYVNKNMFLSLEERKYEDMKKLFGPNIPSLKEVKNNVAMLFLNIHPIWDNNRPVPPNIIYMGGVHVQEEKPLPQHLKKYMDDSKNGVIYMSLGANVDPTLLSPDRVKIFLNVFARLPYDILVKWNSGEIPGAPKNVRVQKWFPQSDVLKHPKIKLFIMQGGLQSTDEAIKAGVPMIGLPMLGDQWFNVENYIRLHIGKGLQFDKLTETELETAIETVINDNSYRQSIEKLRSIMSDQPQTPLERAVWWTEHVIRHGGAKHLRPPAANMSITEYFELELVLTILAALLVLVIIASFVLYLLLRAVIKVFTKDKKVKRN